MEELRVPVPGGELHVTLVGAGRPVICMSGAGTPIYVRTTPDELYDRMRFVYVELRGTGRSSGEPRDLTFEAMCADFDALRDALGLESPFVWGHSIHSVPAMRYAHARPDSVSGAIVVGGLPVAVSSDDLFMRQIRFWEANASDERKAILEERRRTMPAGGFVEFYVANAPMYFFDPTYEASPLWEGCVVRDDAYDALVRMSLGFDARTDAADVPTFVASGRHDYAAPCSDWTDIADELPHADIVVYERSGHYPQFEEPDAFRRDLFGWLDRR